MVIYIDIFNVVYFVHIVYTYSINDLIFVKLSTNAEYDKRLICIGEDPSVLFCTAHCIAVYYEISLFKQ